MQSQEKVYSCSGKIMSMPMHGCIHQIPTKDLPLPRGAVAMQQLKPTSPLRQSAYQFARICAGTRSPSGKGSYDITRSVASLAWFVIVVLTPDSGGGGGWRDRGNDWYEWLFECISCEPERYFGCLVVIGTTVEHWMDMYQNPSVSFSWDKEDLVRLCGVDPTAA